MRRKYLIKDEVALLDFEWKIFLTYNLKKISQNLLTTVVAIFLSDPRRYKPKYGKYRRPLQGKKRKPIDH